MTEDRGYNLFVPVFTILASGTIMFKTSKNVDVIVVRNELYMFKILGQKVSMRPVFGL